MKSLIFCFILLSSIVLAQTFTNISSESFGDLKYEVGTDFATYSRPSVLHCFFKITNISDRDVSFQTPSPDLCYFRVTMGHHEVDLFPLAVLPVIGDYYLRSGESVADTQMWDISPAIWDTTYQLWGILNIATAWEPFPKDSHFVEFSIGETVIIDSPMERRDDWFVPSPVQGAIELPFEGRFELFDISGRIVATAHGVGALNAQSLPPGM
ncbi:MAG TPA: hypothetical protein ENN07_04280 [candidate division Zixibacteria bacterium]|nr:hypothetical protein [candidate division Zixibacteria bacterium]